MDPLWQRLHVTSTCMMCKPYKCSFLLMTNSYLCDNCSLCRVSRRLCVSCKGLDPCEINDNTSASVKPMLRTCCCCCCMYVGKPGSMPLSLVVVPADCAVDITGPASSGCLHMHCSMSTEPSRSTMIETCMTTKHGSLEMYKAPHQA